MPILHYLLPVLFLLYLPQPRPGSGMGEKITIPEEICLSPFELALYEELNSYRAIHGLPPIALSRSLTLVAQVHCRDLAINQPHRRGNCNMHSWSRNDAWSSCCYTPDHRRSACMWDKPRELTPYEGDGFEIAFHSTATYPNALAFARDAMENWSRSKGHNDVIINRGTWRKINWKAVGVGAYGGYATVWFGMVDDPDKTEVNLCLKDLE